MKDLYKEMCVSQGYVPSTCTLDGQLAWLLVNEGKSPCAGCYMDREVCKGKTREEA